MSNPRTLRLLLPSSANPQSKPISHPHHAVFVHPHQDTHARTHARAFPQPKSKSPSDSSRATPTGSQSRLPHPYQLMFANRIMPLTRFEFRVTARGGRWGRSATIGKEAPDACVASHMSVV
ncbi:hypothetical protein DENSPDRAFT_73621 [Dentipellis sp. KUC8613]|nr:hypothetical protein DENSPDRAFT_73621 [Dentipellis sp. KUC8613]